MKKFLAFDFGASSIRLFLLSYENQSIVKKEIYRVKNKPIQINGQLVWDLNFFESAIYDGLKKVKDFTDIVSIGFDTWGVDYVWLDKNNQVMFYPACYRNDVTKEIVAEVHKIISKDELYQITGLSYNPINSIYRIFEDIHYKKVMQKGGQKILFLPDYFSYLLSKRINYDFSIASTSGLVDCHTKKWSAEIFCKLEIPSTIVGPLNYEPKVIGQMINEKFTNVPKQIKVVSVFGHDSASAVFGAGILENKIFVINGTWSLVGTVRTNAFANQATYDLGFSNEGYFKKMYRLNKLFVGLWIQQKLFEEWFAQDEINYTLLKTLNKTSNFSYALNPEEPIFATNCQMSQEIKNYCERESIVIDINNWGDVLNLVQNGIINKIQKLVDFLRNEFAINDDELTLIGGGNNDEVFCQKIATCLSKKIALADAESSILGNGLAQLIANNEIKITEVKTIIENSIKKITYYPGGKHE